MRPQDIQPGDVILHPAVNAWPSALVVVHSLTVYPMPLRGAGSVSYRYRHLSNPRGIDWSGFLDWDVEVTLVSRGVCRVDDTIRTLLPG